MSQLQQTLVLVKPDGVSRRLTGEILARIEAKGYRIAALELRTADAELLEQHYAEHAGKPFYGALAGFMASGPLVAAVVEGYRVIEGIRTLIGATDPTVALPGSIRGDLASDAGQSLHHNLVHASDSEASAEREIALWFPA